jgi:hypothetical protein
MKWRYDFLAFLHAFAVSMTLNEALTAISIVTTILFVLPGAIIRWMDLLSRRKNKDTEKPFPTIK